MSGICKNCGKPLQWTGHLWLHCQHCGQLQIWPVSAESEGDSYYFEDKEDYIDD